MAAIGIGLLWAGYWLSISGVSLLKGWNNSPWGLANPVKLAQFTTDCYTGTGIIPTGDPADSGPCSSGSSATTNPPPGGTATAPVGASTKPVNGKCPRGYHLAGGRCVSDRTPSGLH